MDPMISPTLDPRVIVGEHAASRGARDAFTRIHARLGKLHTAEGALNADRTLDPVARSAQIADLRLKIAAELKPAFEKAHAQVAEALAGVETKIDERLYSGVKTASREEIRQHVRRMPTAQRASFVRERARAGDAQTVAAVLTAPGYLSNLDDAGQRGLRDSIVADVAPDLHAEREELRSVSRRIENGAKAFEAAYIAARPHRGAELGRARAKAVADASEAA
ncbi:MAG TPA: hypothetical protein VKH41_16425 [Myxococcota bacterium]|nr:hypothetical protein [Myxococcota bacterium]